MLYSIALYIGTDEDKHSLEGTIVEQISCQIWHDRGFKDKSAKTSKKIALDLMNKKGYGPIG